MPRNRQGHSSSDTNITAADITKKSVKASVKSTSDADENTPVGPCEAKTVPATKVNKNLLLNGNVESMETLDAYSINSPTNDPNIKCDIEKKFENCNTSGESKVYAPQSNSHCVDDVDMTVEDTELSDVSESISISTVDVNNVQSRVADSTTCSPKSNSAFPNGDIDIQQSELTSQSGLWPEVSTMSSHTSESHQLGYRLSTTIMETKMSSDEMPTNIIAQKPQVTNEQNNCRLPSSVYGQSSASNIEKVLTGLQFAVQADNMPKQDDLLQKGNNRESMENTLSFKNAMEGHVTLENDSGFSKSPKVAHKEMEKTELENGSRNKNSQSKLKINIPEISNSESSEQSIPESKKTLKFPKITSPQILEQHISKIISENAAIVNTLDPLWSKQYMRQSSLSYNQTLDTEGRKGSFSNKIRRMSEDKTNILASGESNPSKLQSALLGTLETKSTIGSTDAIGVPYVPSSAVFLAMTTTCTPTYTLTKTITSVMEEELKGNAIKSLLSLKQGRFSENNMFKFDNDKFDQHPQNPEGSIIKDLLLNTKSKTKLSTYTETENSVVCANPSLDLMCIGCGLKFLTQDILEAHSSVCKGPKNNKTASKVIKDNKTNGMSHLNCDPLDKVQVSLPVLNPRALSNSIEVLLKNENSYDGVNADIGPILKKQLLSPFINQKESTLKKRKISDSALSMNKSSVYNELKGENSCDSKKNITINQSSENVTVLSHRSRSQSMHLFGGEVQILDGAVAKKIKISTSLSETVPSATMSVLNNMSYAKCSFYEIQEVKTSSVPLQTVVVTIAQPVHNSGGTVTHIPSQNSPPSLSALMNLPNDVSSSDDIKCSDLSPSVKNWGSIFPAKDLSPITAVNNLAKFSVIQKPSSAVTKVTVANKQPFRVFSTANVIKPLAALSFKPIRENATSSFSALTKLDSCGSPGKSFLPFKSTFSTLGLGITSSAEHSISGKHECKNEIMPFQYLTSRPTAQNIIKSSVPTVLLTPSSPHSFSDEEQNHSDEDGSNSEKARKLLAPSRPNPMRPNSLLLTKKPFTMVGSTLISPETPRPKKNCVQMYINGQAYTYLGLKCSTRSTYCCIYRPQPMFVLQETDPKLSMYSNWQVVPSKEELAGLTPGQMIALYNSKQSPCNSEKLFTTSKMGELLSFTHSSYWTFRSKERDKTDAQLSTNIDDPYSHFSTDVGGSDSSYPEFIQSTYGNCITDPFSYSDNAKTFKRDGRTSSVSDNTSSLDVEASLSDADVNNSQDEDDDDDDERADVLTDSSQSQAPKRVKIFEGGFKSNEDYTYVRGRGRGKYVCEECGIRCKKPSMLKKHIRTHTDLRPYKCRHCSFAFKTKGNLTKHMKSKAHHKKCTELGIVPVPTSTDDYQIDEEALAKQEQLKKRNLPFSDGESIDEDDDDDDDDFDESDGLDEDCESDTSSCIMSMNTNSKLSVNNFCETESGGNVVSGIIDETITTATEESIMQRTVEQEAARSLLHLSSLSDASEQWPSNTGEIITVVTSDFGDTTSTTLTPITSNCLSPVISHKGNELSTFLTIPEDHMGHRPRSYSADIPFGGGREQLIRQQQAARTAYALVESTAKEAAESLSKDSNPRRYSISVAREARKPRSQTVHWGGANTNVLLQKWPEIENAEQPMDLRVPRSIPTIPGKHEYGTARNNVITLASPEDTVNVLNTEIYLSENFTIKPLPLLSSQVLSEYDGIGENSSSGFGTTVSLQDSQQSGISAPQPPMFYTADRAVASVSAGRKEGDPMDDLPSPEVQEFSISSPVSPSNLDDNCFTPEIMIPSNLAETLQTSSQLTSGYTKPGSSNMEEGKCVCRICNKIFAKAGQLRIHVNIHYFERPFRCDNCGVSFRTKGHLQKHKRSVSHYNKVNMNMTFGTPSIDNPRPFKCADCKIAFRIHGHLAKHLRSKMHIMKLECLGKLPFGMYAEMERSGVSLNEIDTTDCNNSLESLQVMAQKLYQRDPRRMRWQSPTLPQTDHETQKCPTSTLRIVDAIAPVPEPIPITHSSPSVISVPSTVNLNIPVTNPEGGEVKCEPSDVLAFATTPTFAEAEVPAKTSTVLFANQNIAVSSPQPMVRADVSEAEANTTLHRSDTCHICGRMFKSTKFLQVHLYCDHSSWNPPAKEIATPSKTIIDSASNSSGANVVQELACDLCGRHFSNQNSLQQHLLTHAQPRPFVCEVCDAGFTSSSSLVAHLATHQQVNSSTAASTEGSLLQLQ